MKIETEFISRGRKIKGEIFLSDKKNYFIIFIPGLSGLNEKRFHFLREAVLKLGYNFFQFDVNNNNLQEITLDDELIQLRDVIEHLEKIGYNLNHFGIIAKSFGSVKAFLLEDKRKSFIIHLAPAAFFANTSNIKSLLNRKYKDIDRIDELRIGKKVLTRNKIPNLIFHGEKDITVDPKNSKKIFSLLNNQKDLIIIKRADHGLNRKVDHEIIKKSMKRFVEKV